MYNKRLFMSNEMRDDPDLISSCVLHCNKFCGMPLPFCVANGHKSSIAYYGIIDYYRNAAGSRGSRRLGFDWLLALELPPFRRSHAVACWARFTAREILTPPVLRMRCIVAPKPTVRFGQTLCRRRSARQFVNSCLK